MRFCILIIGLSLSAIGWAQTPLEIKFVNETIEVDGKLEESVWETLPVYTNFHNYLPTDEGLAENQTEVRLFHNGEQLVISAIYNDTTSKVQLSSLKRDDIGNSVAESETFIFIMDTQLQQQSAYYFAVNMGGTQVDGLVERINEGFTLSSNWNTVWKAATQVNGTKKQYEIAIPFKNLSFNQDNEAIAIQTYVRDIKNNSWTIFTDLSRNYRLFDLRFTQPFKIDQLPKTTDARFAVIPSTTVNYSNDVLNDTDETSFVPSLDVQYNVSSSLKLDATINPDFSQIDVDQQVTNLTRFSVFFPERRNFFLENADLFSNLGLPDVNPFYSRRIGAATAMQFGVKLSGNLSPKTRIGLLNAQTEAEGDDPAQNFGVLVGEHQLSKRFTATGFLVNRQETEGFGFEDDYNRVTGLNLNYKSIDRKWTGVANAAKSFTSNVSGKDGFYNIGMFYNVRGADFGASIRHVQRNYVADVGFTPRLFNFDAEQEVTVREGYTQSRVEGTLNHFPTNSESINQYRYFFGSNNTYWDEAGKLQQSSSFYNTALFFKELSAVYLNLYYDYVNLKYAFDPLSNGNPLVPDSYNYVRARAGYNSARNKSFVYNAYAQYGQFYSGLNTTLGGTVNYRLLPYANLLVSYQLDDLDLNELGQETFHLAQFTGEVFFTNRLNWTTYIQYSTQNDNLNFNSRLQWEYKPLSYVFLVITDNFNEQLERTNWGVALKVNYRLDF
ncbi:DUF5916 domain-containing protein [Aureisphaera galaxeae]|uniref:DUF5916 domain-containing protein n=1 Tax=Aureisphaera galaxeae TaxID=1538023 RepID=UPI0023503071|nr:DUF5916 domain-containing protein [Aureisphaera galaxeae]MDC8004254.1 DUF5916 domain-containing protein [Aureisphaera galaxeae]